MFTLITDTKSSKGRDKEAEFVPTFVPNRDTLSAANVGQAFGEVTARIDPASAQKPFLLWAQLERGVPVGS